LAGYHDTGSAVPADQGCHPRIGTVRFRQLSTTPSQTGRRRPVTQCSGDPERIPLSFAGAGLSSTPPPHLSNLPVRPGPPVPPEPLSFAETFSQKVEIFQRHPCHSLPEHADATA